MASSFGPRRLTLLFLSFLVAVIVTIGWAAPAAAASRYAEAPAQLTLEGLTAQEHLRLQAELSAQLVRELPATALQKAVPLSSEEVAAIDQAPRFLTPLKIGLVKALASSIEVAGLDRNALSRTPEGKLVWAAVVTANNAGAIRLHVEDMSLPRGAELFVYSMAGEVYGPYTRFGPNGNGNFWTTAVFGSQAILQLRVNRPNVDLSRVSFRVMEAGLITEKFAGALDGRIDSARQVKAAPGTDAVFPCGNSSCVMDATCVNNTQANAAKLATAKMEWVSGAFLYTCTGGLISDNNPTQSNFFLTANHCLSKNSTAQNVSFYWQFATLSCNGTCPVNAGWALKTTGSTVSATNRKGDFTLLRLSTNPPAGSVFLGWTNAPVANSNGADLFRVSNPQFGPQVYSQHDVDTSAPTCTGWPRGERIYSRDLTGATDGGSSGSPVVNASLQVVGQLSGACGFNPSDPCAGGPGEDNATVDGAFAFYYPTIQPIINP